MSINIKIDELLQDKNKTRYWLHKETGITYANISKLCEGHTKSINFTVLEKVCEALKCEPKDIIKKE